MPPDTFAPAFNPPETGAHAAQMQDFVATLLRHEGALVEPIEPEGLEILAPAPVQLALGIGEFARLGFGAALPPAAERVGIEGDWLDRFGKLLGARGSWARRVLPVSARAPSDHERVLAHELQLDNATFRFQSVTPAWTRYLVLDFRASAVSDEKRDFLLRLGINLATGALPDAVMTAIAPALDDDLFGNDTQDAAPEPDDLPPLWDRARVLRMVSRALPPRLDTALDPFVKALRRRLDRDQDRLHQYHNDLYCDAMRRAEALPEDDPRRARDMQRADAIGREYHAKLDDLARQYATRVTVTWCRTLELVMPVHRYTVQIRRRKAERTITLDWNPLARRMETPACDATASPERPRLACDDAVHLVVPAGLASCPGCGRGFCRACHEKCPKCKTDIKRSVLF